MCQPPQGHVRGEKKRSPVHRDRDGGSAFKGAENIVPKKLKLAARL